MPYHTNNSSTNDLYTGSIAAAPLVENEPLSDINTDEHSINLDLSKNVYGICNAIISFSVTCWKPNSGNTCLSLLLKNSLSNSGALPTNS